MVFCCPAAVFRVAAAARAEAVGAAAAVAGKCSEKRHFLPVSEVTLGSFCCGFWRPFRHEIRWCFAVKEARFTKARWRQEAGRFRLKARCRQKAFQKLCKNAHSSSKGSSPPVGKTETKGGR